MDNISGSAKGYKLNDNMTHGDYQVEDPVEKPPLDIACDVDDLGKVLAHLKENYKYHANKHLGDTITSLEISITSLSKVNPMAN